MRVGKITRLKLQARFTSRQEVKMTLLLLFYQIRYSRENAKQQMESLSEEPVYRGFSNYAKIRVSRQIDLHGVNNLVHLLVRKLACAGF